MLCLIAVEENAASVIRDNLIDSGLYPGWEFPLCNNAKELVLWNRNNVDVLLLSRFLLNTFSFLYHADLKGLVRLL